MTAIARDDFFDAVEIKSYGGDYGGYVIPFDLHFCGDRVKGKFDPATKTFTADAA